MFTTFAGGWPSLVLWMFHRSWHSSVVLGEACALDVNTFLLLYDPRQALTAELMLSFGGLPKRASSHLPAPRVVASGSKASEGRATHVGSD